jgi:hypothetical protein
LDLKRYIFVMLLMLFVSACTGTATQYPPTIPPREVTAVPTLDPNAPTPTLDPSAVAQTPSGIESGGGTYTTRDGRLSFIFPQGWFVQESAGQVVVVNNRAAFQNTPLAGQYQVNFVISPIGEIPVGQEDTVQANISALDALNQLAAQYEIGGTQVSDPFEDTMGGRTVYFVRINNPAFDSLLGMMDIDGTHIAMAAVSARGELSVLEPIARTIGTSLQYTP